MIEVIDSQSQRFDFITDDAFRSSLESDWHELEACWNAACWKAVHVLAGSIVEALLADLLDPHAALVKLAAGDVYAKDLNSLVQLCSQAKLITERTVQLSSVVRGYRNLIHPGRIIRLNETIDANSAAVAKSVVAMVISEVEAKKRDEFGYTAQQVLTKIEADSTVMSILPHLLKSLSRSELRRLVLHSLPEQYCNLQFSSDEPVPSAHLERLAHCFRLALALCDVDVQRQAAEQLVRVLKEHDSSYVRVYETVFFRASDLGVLNKADREMVKVHLLEQLRVERSKEIVVACTGLAQFLTDAEIPKYVDLLVPLASEPKHTPKRGAVSDLLIHECGTLSDGPKKKFEGRLRDWVKLYRDKNNTAALTALSSVRVVLLDDFTEDDIPF